MHINLAYNRSTAYATAHTKGYDNCAVDCVKIRELITKVAHKTTK